jgi:hypothetical protein
MMTKQTDNSGNVKFLLEKNIKGNCELSAVSANNDLKGDINFEIPETFKYTISIYLKEFNK